MLQFDLVGCLIDDRVLLFARGELEGLYFFIALGFFLFKVEGRLDRVLLLKLLFLSVFLEYEVGRLVFLYLQQWVNLRQVWLYVTPLKPNSLFQQLIIEL